MSVQSTNKGKAIADASSDLAKKMEDPKSG
jgi:hypothetical protein